MKHELKVGDLILVTDGTFPAKQMGWIGTVKQVTELYNYYGTEYHYRAKDLHSRESYYVNGVTPSSLLKELL
jgi:hypothetical protein